MAPGIISDDAEAVTSNGVTHELETNSQAVTNRQSVTDKKTTNGEVARTEKKESVGDKVTNGDATTEEKKEEKKVDETTISSDSKDEPKKNEKPVDQTMKCEIKHLDRRYDDKDVQYFAERKNDEEAPPQKDWWQLFAFCMVRHFDSDGDLDCTRLHVNPQPLRQLLKDVIGNYPTDPIDVDDVQIESPYHSLFHFRKPLEAEGLERFKDDAESLSQFKLLLGWINTHFELDISAHAKCMSGDLKAIAYDRLWTLFPPNTIVHTEVLDQNRAYRVYNTWYESGEIPRFYLTLSFVDFDGENIGTRRTQLYIPKYIGTQDLRELSCMPLSMHNDADVIREQLVARGRKFESLIGQHYMEYNGVGLKRGERGYIRFNVAGRVMVDCKTYHRLDPNDSFLVSSFPDAKAARNKKPSADAEFATETRVFDKLSDDDACITNATVRGYSFTVKRFLEFMVDDVAPIKWNTTCFDDLVLDPAVKKTVRALVSSHSQKRDSFDDIVKGKGQGLVCVLHGPPGVGKTLTAECVAEYVQRPLYMVSSGDLGTDSGDLDHELTRIMDMTATWRAVLLIDEADVFLEQRALHDLHRNAMVSVFLRVLEYYGGILFLTTNRVNTFDEAFKSRIHIPIRYTDLSYDSRRQIWKNFCGMVPGGVDINEKGYDILAEHDFNGRQIKNAIKAAESLAAYDEVKLDLAQLLQVTKIQAMFEKDLTNLSGVDYTAPGQSKKDADSRNMFL